jgi:antitoxin Xre/MbcA/ParS-like protein
MDIPGTRRRAADRANDAANPLPVDLRPDPAVRRRLSGPALRTFFNIAAAWHLSVQEQRALLGWPAASTFHKYKSGDHGALTFDTLTRLSLLIGIYKSLQVLYPEPVFADQWPRMPNSHPMFGGRPALTLMTDGGIDGLFRVRRLLDSRRGGWS